MNIKKYKLQDLVAKGSSARKKVDSDLLVGDVSAGYGYGDILDANATSQLISSSISTIQSFLDGDLSDKLQDLQTAHEEYEQIHQQLEQLVTNINQYLNTIQVVDGDNLVIG